MDLPNYIIIICNINGDVLQSPDNVNITKVMDILHEDCLLIFHDRIKSMFEMNQYLQTFKLKLKNNKDYYLTVEIINGKICCTFQLCEDTNIKNVESYWSDTILKYNYHMNKYMKILNSLSNLIENIFYKNRSDIKNIVIELCTVLKIQYCLVMFHNGKDHMIFCKDNISNFECENLEEKEDIKIDDELISQNIYKKITDILIIKRYENTYFNMYFKEKLAHESKVYVLKLSFGDTVIGYFEFIPHSFIELEKTEIKIIQSLSSILAYVIYNKNEELEIKKYITEKLIVSTNKLKS